MKSFLMPAVVSIVALAIFLGLVSLAQSDIIPPDSKRITMCERVVNLNEFPDLVIVGLETLGDERNRYVVVSDKCLTVDYKFNRLTLIGIQRGHFNEVGLDNLDFENDPAIFFSDVEPEPEDWWADEDSPLEREMVEYRVLGFSQGKLVIYKSRQSFQYSDGRPDEVKTFDPPEVEGVTTEFPAPTPVE